MNRTDATDGLPLAKKRPSRTLSGLVATKLWWLTAICAIVAIGLFVAAVDRSTKVSVQFRDGHGIKPGDAVRYRGVAIGEVASVDVSQDLESIRVKLSLEPKSAGIARDKSQFWVQRPQLSLSRVSGLETVVGANYIGVLPGPPEAPRRKAFVGLESPPTLADRAPLTIRIRFRNGYGITPGDPLKHRGIQVGEVHDVTLDRAMQSVLVSVRLVESASDLARQGSRFWIERPEINLQGVRGLETVVGGRYLAVQPGPEDAKSQSTFEGLDRSPPVIDRREGGLEIVLESTERQGLTPGSPVKYRGIEIGRITAVGLASDSSRVEARAYISPGFRSLVREQTRFWADSGLQVNLGPLQGFELDLESLSTLAAGGVALAVPEESGRPVTTGHRFLLDNAAPERWREWQPSIPLGNSILPEGIPMPKPVRISAEWSQRRLGFSQTRQTEFWGVVVQGNHLISICDLLTPADESTVAVDGKEYMVQRSNVFEASGLGLITLSEPTYSSAAIAETSQVRAPNAPEDILIVADPLQDGVPISAGRLTQADGQWQVHPALAFESDWNGASAVSREDGAVVGMLRIDKADATIELVSKALTRRLGS